MIRRHFSQSCQIPKCHNSTGQHVVAGVGRQKETGRRMERKQVTLMDHAPAFFHQISINQSYLQLNVNLLVLNGCRITDSNSSATLLNITCLCSARQ